MADPTTADGLVGNTNAVPTTTSLTGNTPPGTFIGTGSSVAENADYVGGVNVTNLAEDIVTAPSDFLASKDATLSDRVTTIDAGDPANMVDKNNYFMDVLDDAVRFFGQYADRILFLSMGNHEDSVKKRHELDLLSIMSYKLKQEYNWKGTLGPYEGWLLFRVLEGSTAKNRGTIKAYYTHGAGGNAPVTRGVIQTSRRQVQISADMFISGHIHTQFAFPIPQRMVNNHGVEEIRDIVHLQLGCFKESHRGSWEAQRGFGPANIGGYWVKFFLKDKKPRFIEERTIY